jgi:uncharacterized membrane protein YfcA
VSGAEIAVVLVAAAFASVVKSITGTGYPLVLIPVLALFGDVADAVVLVALPNLWLNGSLIWQARAAWSEASADLTRFLAASVVGGATGALLLPILPDRLLRLALVAVIAIFVVNRIRSPQWSIEPPAVRRWGPTVGAVSGVFQGAAGISGPLVIPWFLGQKSAREIYLVSVGSAFALSGLAQIVVLGAQGRFTPEILGLAVGLILMVLVLFPLGVRLRERLDVDTFERVVIGLLILSAISLLVRAL